MKTQHTHHKMPRAQGGTDHPDNLEEIDFIEHARLHAEEFLSGGQWFDFRHWGYPYLEEDLKDRLLEEASRRQQGNGGRWGGDGTQPHPQEGYHWWTNGTEDRKSPESPGEGWYLGRSIVVTDHLSSGAEATRGTKWWNDGETQVRREDCPGDGWEEGCLPETNEKKGRPGEPKSEEWKQNMSEIRVGSKNPCYGRRWVTDGVTNKYLAPGEEIPENYELGRTL
jgi:hypothetical protein